MPQNIPVLYVQEHSLALAYEKSLITLYHNGIAMTTQYDKPGDPQSLDSTMDITVIDPLSEPMIHKAFPGGIEDLREYVMELMGAKDHWVRNINDKADTRWEYTYHGRLSAYGTWRELRDGASASAGPFNVNQIDHVIDKLAAQPYTRQAQMITWMPTLDLDCFDPPCLQSLWYRILQDDDGVWWLNCNVRFRSNDAWGANFMNMFGFIQFNRNVIAAGVAQKTGRIVKLGRLNWHADSFHIYGKDIHTAREMLFDRIGQLTVEERMYDFSDEFIQSIYNEAEAAVKAKIAEHDRSH